MSIITTFSLLIALAGCNDNGVTAFNASPEAAITSHVDGAEVFEGMTVTFRGSASDPDDATATLTTTWYLGTAEACPATLADDTGVTSCDIAIGIDDTEVTLEVTDPGAASGSASITLTVVPTDSPDAEIVTPEASGVYYSDQKITFEGVVSDGEDAAEDLIAHWESDIDGLLKEVEAVPNAEGAVDDADYLSEGEHYLTLTVEDTTGKTGSDSVTITVGPPNSGPTCSITAPDDNSAGPEGELVIFEGLVDDVDVPADWLSVAWSSDKDGDLGESAPDSEGKVAFPYSDLSVETHVVTMTTTDEIGATCTSFIIYTVGEPPEVEITLPTDGSVLQQGDAVTFTATVSDNEDLPNEVALVWSSDVDGVLSKAGSDSSGSAIHVTSGLSAGPHLVTLLGTDTDGLFSTDTVYITVNQPPVIDSIDITPATGVTTTTTLTCTATGTDPEDGALTPALTWSNAANLSWVPTGSSVTLTAADASPGDEIACTATITDIDGATASASTSVFVENSAPSISSVTITPNPAVAGDSLTCSYSGFSDVDGDADASTLEWFVNGASEGTTATLATALVQGDTVECTVTPTDGADSGTPVSDSLTVSNTAPVLTDVSLGPDPAYEDDTLVCTAGSAADVDGSAVTFTYAWRVNSAPIAATTETLTGADFNKNDDVSCSVTPNDGTDDGVAVTSNTVTISNSVPSIASVSISPNPASATDTLTCGWIGFSDADGDTDASTISWTVNAAFAGSGTTLSSAFVGGDTVTCTVTPEDGSATGVALSDTIVIDNTMPSISSVTITPDPAVAGDSLTCSYSGFSDVDGDADASTLEWFVNGTSEGTTPTLTTTLVQGDSVICTVTPTDGTDTGTPVSDSLTISNTAPVLVDVSLGPDPAYEADTLTCTAGSATDADGSAVTFDYAWAINGGTIAATTNSLTGADFDKNDNVSCSVTPNDGTDSGTAVTSNTVIISNSAPTISSVAINPNPAMAPDTLTCSWSGYSDADGDTDRSTVNWQINSVDAGTTAVLMSGFVGGDTVTCTVTAFDNGDTGNALTDTVVISNTPPQVFSVELSPVNPDTTDTIIATVLYSDADGSAGLVLNHTWTVNGVLSGVTADRLTGDNFDKHDEISCTVTPNDGIEDGDPVTSPSVYAVNTAPEAPFISIIPAAPVAGADDLVCSVDVDSYDLDGDSITYSYEWQLDGAYYSTGSTVPGTDTNAGEFWTCTATPNDGDEDGASNSATIEIIAPVGLGVDCLDILESGNSTGDGIYWIDPLATGAYQVYCVMDANYDGGGWTLAVVSSDDDQDTWTWNNRHYWDTDATTFGDVASLNRDFKSPALHDVAMGELLFIHAPSGVWAGYADVGDSIGSLGLQLGVYGEYVEYPTGVGHPMSSGTLSNTGLLCSTDLFLNPCDLEGGSSCHVDQNGAAHGPAWSAFENSGCPLDDPSLTALGGQPLDPDWEAVSSKEVGLSPPGNAVGFGNALGLNTGAVGTGENYIWVLVRRGEQAPNLGTEDNPGIDCLDILESGDSTGNGTYWVSGEDGSDIFAVYCDMTTNGGGWGLVAKISASDAENWQYESSNYYDSSVFGDATVLDKTDAKSRLYSEYMGQDLLIWDIDGGYYAAHSFSATSVSWSDYLSSIQSQCGYLISSSALAILDDGRDSVIGSSLYFKHYGTDADCNSQERSMFAQQATHSGYAEIGIGTSQTSGGFGDAAWAASGSFGSYLTGGGWKNEGSYAFFVR